VGGAGSCVLSECVHVRLRMGLSVSGGCARVCGGLRPRVWGCMCGVYMCVCVRVGVFASGVQVSSIMTGREAIIIIKKVMSHAWPAVALLSPLPRGDFEQTAPKCDE
jgi:hypothetical protein